MIKIVSLSLASLAIATYVGHTVAAYVTEIFSTVHAGLGGIAG